MKGCIFFTRFFFSLLSTIPMLRKVKRLEKKGNFVERDAYIHRVSTKWMKDNVIATGSTVTVNGLENLPQDEAVVYISNHQGNFDIPLLMGYIDRPKGFISKVEVQKIPIINKWMEYINCVFMDRSNMRASASAIMAGIKLLKEGHSLVIFPEGTRSKGDQMGEFKSGSFKLATKSGAPIVPITIDGSYHLMEENGIQKGHVTLTVHPAIPTKGLSKEELAELPDKVHQIIASALPTQS
ncbi:lysophospholipid acyltransferase family protein [Cellulosilyticum ruminicola]|uniref:lysophospholipid acyltransferase family protein n=1 Tax=Cellulosilyticum ruminicola TaxID=425254 RepID=UPI0006D26C0B|nr:lysophospholipid acyltransferase family protein [Cellulosilyticum ruminicola]